MKLTNLPLLILTVILMAACSQKAPREIKGINGKRVEMRSGPGETHDKIVNEKATAILKEVYYLEVDQTVKVEVLEHNGDWSKVHVIEPKALSKTHTGWIPSKYLVDTK